MCWSQYEQRRLREQEEQRKEEELRALEALAEERAKQVLARQKEHTREPVRS